MEIDYIFPRGIFSSIKSSRAKILTEWKTSLSDVLLFAELHYYIVLNYLIFSQNVMSRRLRHEWSVIRSPVNQEVT